MKRFCAFLIVFSLGCQAKEPELVMSDDELYDCQSSARGEQRCASPQKSEVKCCPISNESCDGRYMGGAEKNGQCSIEADGIGTSFLGKDEDGCFYVRAAESCFSAWNDRDHGYKDMDKDLGVDMADELLNCQSSWPPQEQKCVSPKDPSIFCCPISDGDTCDARYIGGSPRYGECGRLSDGYGVGFVGRDENGCFYVRAAGSCFLPPDMNQDM